MASLQTLSRNSNEQMNEPTRNDTKLFNVTFLVQRCYVSHRSHRCQGVLNFGDQTRNGGARQLNWPERCSRKFQRLPRAPRANIYRPPSFAFYDMQNVYSSRDTCWYEIPCLQGYAKVSPGVRTQLLNERAFFFSS